MNSKEIVLGSLYNMGKSEAQALRARAAAGDIDDTTIIDQEHAVPRWSEKNDYSKSPVGMPVKHDGQVYGLLQPHNASYYNATPAELHALWRVKHTKDPKKAKAWVKPSSTSDMYRAEECMIWTDGSVRRAKRDTAYSPEEYEYDWEMVENQKEEN